MLTLATSAKKKEPFWTLATSDTPPLSDGTEQGPDWFPFLFARPMYAESMRVHMGFYKTVESHTACRHRYSHFFITGSQTYHAPFFSQSASWPS